MLVFAACVGGGWDGLDPDDPCCGPVSVLEASRYVDAWDDCEGVERVGAGACVMYSIFAGVHHSNDKCVDVLD